MTDALESSMNEVQPEYVGFWLRVGASLIDTLLTLAICFPLVTWIYGKDYWTSTALVQGPLDFLLTWVLPAVAVILFWIYRQATPGKMAVSARIVDSRTGGRPEHWSVDRAVLRVLRVDPPADGRNHLGRVRRAQAGLARQARQHRGRAHEETPAIDTGLAGGAAPGLLLISE